MISRPLWLTNNKLAMPRLIFALTITFCGFCINLLEAQVLPVDQFQPTRPIRSPVEICGKVIDGQRVKYISDVESKCHYWICTVSRSNPAPTRCGLGTYVSDLYAYGLDNPCSESNPTHGYINPLSNQDGVQFDCTRKKRPTGNEVPPCVIEYRETNRCKNGGSIAYGASKCWCVCTEDWSNHICTQRRARYAGFDISAQHPSLNRLSRPYVNSALRHISNIQITVPPPPSIKMAQELDDEPRRRPNAPRVDGPLPPGYPVPPHRSEPQIVNGKYISGDPCEYAPPEDFCSKLINGEQFCMNGGTCVNQCLGAVCLCPRLFTAGRRCEIFNCMENVDCMNGGTCTRGGMADVEGWNNDPVFNCICESGWAGKMCEIKD